MRRDILSVSAVAVTAKEVADENRTDQHEADHHDRAVPFYASQGEPAPEGLDQGESEDGPQDGPLAAEDAGPAESASVARVAMSGGTLKRVMMKPLMRPASHPAPTARTMATGRANPTFFQNTPTRIAERPSIDPTERSMPPVTITKVMVSATRPTSAIRRPWLRRLSAVKKRSDWAARTASATTTITARIVSCRSSRRRNRAMGRSSEGPAAPGHVGEHRREDQEPEDRLQPVGGNVHED